MEDQKKESVFISSDPPTNVIDRSEQTASLARKSKKALVGLLVVGSVVLFSDVRSTTRFASQLLGDSNVAILNGFLENIYNASFNATRVFTETTGTEVLVVDGQFYTTTTTKRLDAVLDFSATAVTTNTTRSTNIINNTILQHHDGSNNSTMTGLWLHVIDYAEGMAAWRITISELVFVAKILDATLVEPCVYKGRLKSCGVVDSTLRLGDIFDLRPAKRVHAKIVSHEEFLRQTKYQHGIVIESTSGDNTATSTQLPKTRIFRMCVDRTVRKDGTCHRNKNTTKTKSTMFKEQQPALEQAEEVSKSSTVVLEILQMRRNGLSKWKRRHDDNPAIDAVQANRLMRKLRFHRLEFARVKSFLQKFNITNDTPFAAVQWRPEIELDYMECARAILKARDMISSRDKIPKDNFVLMSPLSLRPSLEWQGVEDMARENTEANESLSLLLDSGFHKLEQAFGDEVKDGSLLAVWDMITATLANTYTTCSRCEPPNICAKCNYQGKAAKYSLELRRDQRKGKEGNTDMCWPALED